MAKGLETLIRVNEWTVDERRRELGARLKEQDSLKLTLVNLEKELNQEQHTVSTSPGIAGFFYGDYAESVINRRTELQALITAKEGEILAAQEKLGQAYRELKKYEVVYEEQRRHAEKDALRVEQSELDELGRQNKYFRERQ